MDKIREFNVFILLCALVVSVGTSKCPESRKPHVTSCTIFYNCINLPEGGYVWAPAKCSDGLVFQPYLRICVLPGDTWICDNLSTEKIPLVENYENPELIDASKTSYHIYDENSSSETDRSPLGSFSTKTDNSEFGNHETLSTPYPLIEFVDKNVKKADNSVSTKTKNSMTRYIEEMMKNYLYRYVRNEEDLHTRFTSGSVIGDEKNFPWLGGIIDRMLLYQSIVGFVTRTSCETVVESNTKKTGNHEEITKNMLNYLAQSYVDGKRRETMGKMENRKKKKNNRKSTTTEKIDTAASTTVRIIDPESSLLNGPKMKNNIVVIEGNLGGKEYITIAKYKALSSEIKLRIIEILPCARGIRLPNRTDCTRYYTCDPDTAKVNEFSCSAKTAFNDYNRVCDVERYKTCSRENDEETDATTINYFTTETNLFYDETEISATTENPCRNTGKFVDSISDKHYYVCYSSQANPSRIESLRMICPNELIFCQDRRVCSTRKRCYDI